MHPSYNYNFVSMRTKAKQFSLNTLEHWDLGSKLFNSFWDNGLPQNLSSSNGKKKMSRKIAKVAEGKELLQTEIQL